MRPKQYIAKLISLVFIIVVSKSECRVQDEEIVVLAHTSLRNGGSTITKKQMDDFKANHHLPTDLELLLQDISNKNNFLYNGKTYELEGKPVDIFSRDATYRHNGIVGEVPKTNVFQIEDDEDEVAIAIKNPEGELKTVMITEKGTGNSIFLESVANDVLVSQKIEDTDFGGFRHRGLHLESNVTSEATKKKTTEMNNSCENYREIELAIAYESSFCAVYDGAGEADEEVINLIAKVSLKYQQEGLCIKVILSHLEGYCDPDVDPYKQYVDSQVSGCLNQGDDFGVIDFVREYWNSNRGDVKRDVMHFFSGTNLECFSGGSSCVVGCAYSRSTTCIRDDAYSIAHVTYFSENSGKRATVVAHEIGHNNGAEHYLDVNGNYVMSPTASLALNGFSIQSINSFNAHFSLTACVTDEALSNPTRSPSSGCKNYSYRPLALLLRRYLNR